MPVGAGLVFRFVYLVPSVRGRQQHHSAVHSRVASIEHAVMRVVSAVDGCLVTARQV